MYCYTGICNSVIRSGFVYLIMCFLDFDPFYNDLIKSKPFNLGWLSTLIQAGKESYVDDCSLIEQTFKILGFFVEWKCHLYKVCLFIALKLCNLSFSWQNCRNYYSRLFSSRSFLSSKFSFMFNCRLRICFKCRKFNANMSTFVQLVCIKV